MSWNEYEMTFVKDSGLIHVKHNLADTITMCGVDLDKNLKDVALIIAHPDTREYLDTVNCKSCVEWIHA